MLHSGTDPDEIVELVKGTPEIERNIIDSSDSSEEAARRYELVQIMRAFRDARFRPAVLQAYQFKCAVCGIALKLVDAAHIVPVSHPRGTDDVTNGMGLFRSHHAAYDTGLMGVKSDYSIIMNPDAENRLRGAHLDSGLTALRAALPPRITPPLTIEVRPDPAFLSIGLEVRQFPSALIS